MTAEPFSAGTAPRPRLMAAIVAVAFFMQMLDGTIIATSLPAMAADFGTDVVSLNVGFTAYLLTMAIFIPPAGWLAERFGGRNVFLFAIALFTLASLACATAEGLWSFALARAVQGIGGALMTPVGRQIVLRNTPKTQLVQAIALITWPALLAPVIGPVLGGWITTHLSWHWNFLLNLPIGAIGLLLSYRFLEGGDRETPRPFDTLGFVWTAGALASLLMGLEFLSHDGGAGAALLVAAGLLMGFAAIRHLRRALHPLVDLSVLRVETFAISSLGPGTLARTAINATPFLLPLLFQVGLGFDAVRTGSLLLVYFLGNLAMKTVTTRTLRWLGFRTLLVANGILASIFIGLFVLVDNKTPDALLMVILFAAGLTRSMQFTALNTIAFADVDPPQRSAATTLSSMTQQLSQLLAVAISVLVIRLATLWHDGGIEAATQLRALHVALLAMAAIGIAASVRFLVMPRDAGSEVSGNRTIAKADAGDGSARS